MIVISVSVATVMAIITAVTMTVLRINYRQRYDFTIHSRLALLYYSSVTLIGSISASFRSISYQFSALQLHEDEMCVASERTSNSNQAIYQEYSDDASQIAFLVSSEPSKQYCSLTKD